MSDERLFWIFLVALGIIVWQLLPDEKNGKQNKLQKRK